MMLHPKRLSDYGNPRDWSNVGITTSLIAEHRARLAHCIHYELTAILRFYHKLFADYGDSMQRQRDMLFEQFPKFRERNNLLAEK